MKIQGYQHSQYAQIFNEIATPVELERCGGWLLKRQTPLLEYWDAMGCYPIFSCQDWSQLKTDIDSLNGNVVSVVLVTDPFGTFQQDHLSSAFDAVTQYKDHLVTDLSAYPLDLPSGSTKRNTSKSLENLDFEVCSEPNLYLDDWTNLYAQLCERHSITGVRTFSSDSFNSLFEVPGLTMLRASIKGQTVGLHLWMTSGNVAYGHLGATSKIGYDFMASFGLYWWAIKYFRNKLDWLDLGAAPANSSGLDNGLLRFKRRWATGTKPAYLCTRIVNKEKYNQLTALAGSGNTSYFPAYRADEFT